MPEGGLFRDGRGAASRASIVFANNDFLFKDALKQAAWNLLLFMAATTQPGASLRQEKCSRRIPRRTRSRSFGAEEGSAGCCGSFWEGLNMAALLCYAINTCPVISW